MNATTPLSVGDLVFFDGHCAPYMLIVDNTRMGPHYPKEFALRHLSPSSLEDCQPTHNLFKSFESNRSPNICLQTIEQNAELGEIVRIVRNPNWSLLKE